MAEDKFSRTKQHLTWPIGDLVDAGQALRVASIANGDVHCRQNKHEVKRLGQQPDISRQLTAANMVERDCLPPVQCGLLPAKLGPSQSKIVFSQATGAAVRQQAKAVRASA